MNESFLDSFLESKFVNWLWKNHKAIIPILIFIILGGVSYLVLSISLTEIEIGEDFESKAEKVITPKEIDFPQLKQSSYYINPMLKKNIFKTATKLESESEDKLQEFIENLKLKGIMSGTSPRAVIENTKSKETYLVGEGDSFQGIQVKDIETNMITLYYNGKKFYLEL